jgi:hypothetical protein
MANRAPGFRGNGWARTLYLARQADHLPSASSLNAFGVVDKGYY